MTQPQPIQRELFPGRDRLPVPGPALVCPPAVKLTRALRRHWSLALAAFAAASLSTLGAMRLMPPAYVAQATVEFSAPTHLTGVATPDPFSVSDPRDLHTLEWQFNSRASIEAVVRQLHLDQVASPGAAPAGNEAMRKAADGLLSRLEIDPVRESRVLLIRYRDANAARAAAVVNTLIAATVARLVRQRRQSITQAQRALADQLDRSRAQLQAIRAQLRTFAAARPQVAFGHGEGGRESLGESRLRSLENARTQAEIQAIQQQSQVQVGDAQASTLLPESLGVELPSQLLLRRADLETQIRRLAAQYTPQALPLVQARRELAAVDQTLNRFRAAGSQRDLAHWRMQRMQVARLTEAIERQDGVLTARQQQYQNYDALRRAAELRAQLCDELARREQQMTVERGWSRSPVHVVDAAVPPAAPARPRAGLELVAALLAGLLVAPGMVLLRDRLDDRLQPLEASELGAPLLATVRAPSPDLPPAIDSSSQEPFSVASVVLPVLREALDPVLISMHGAARRYGSRVFLVTSPREPDDRSAILLQLARHLTETGEAVLVIDADFRHPRLHEFGGTPATPGVAEFLSGECHLQASVHPFPVEESPHSVDLMPAGESRLTPTQLLSLPTMRELLQSARRQYQWVLIAAAPLLGTDDARLLMDLADAVILVLPGHGPSQRCAGDAMDRLRIWNSPVLGSILVSNALVDISKEVASRRWTFALNFSCNVLKH